ncbi:MAG: lipid-A-disaccharide synthase [Nitrospirota bacterium]|nr:lipid-A-disaccharide synthase [Nitrospirota bacterium]MDH5768370.1 lipid-A-disaccharide synthase [Nitrospirota bacterium]
MDTVMIVTGESSGELYGSLLAKALKTKYPDVHIIGVGGERMSEAGVELISGISSAFGLSEAISSLKAIKDTFSRTIDAIKKFSTKVIVLIDYPDFNIKVAKVAKKMGVKILYYVSPQVWAWRKGRVKTISEISDRIAVILPFEEEIYKGTGVPCEFVGHPVLEEIESLTQDRAVLKAALKVNTDSKVLALLPGSRSHELKKLLPVIMDVVKKFKAEFPDYHYQFIVPIAPNINISKYQTFFDMLQDEGVVLTKENAVKVLAVSDMAVVASGTATLQAALLEVPMVVIYKLSPLTYHLGRLVIDVKYISLVNLLSGKGVVPELIQYRATPGEIIKELKKIMFDMYHREMMLNYFRHIKELFSGKYASQRVAQMIVEMAGWKP